MNITPQIVEASIGAGNLNEAESQVNDVLSSHPESARAHLLKAEILAKEGYLADSQKEFSKVISLDKTGDTVNSPMYKTLTQEYIVLNGHRDTAIIGWGWIIFLLIILAAGGLFLFKRKKDKEEAARKEDAKRARRERDERIKNAEELQRRKAAFFKPKPRDMAVVSDAVVTSTSYADHSPSAPSTTTASASYSVAPNVVSVNSNHSSHLTETIVGVVAAESLLSAYRRRNNDEEDELSARRRRLRQESIDDTNYTLNPILYGTQNAVFSTSVQDVQSKASDWDNATPSSSESSSSSWSSSDSSSSYSSSDSSSSYSSSDSSSSYSSSD
jgi:tetratricopeptide (TPR) repeat protein